MSPYKILFQLTGSIACYKACELISLLVQSGAEVQTVCSPSALKFIGPSTLEGLTGKAVFSDSFAKGRQMDHIFLARWCDLSLLCPASAQTINSLATGTAPGVIGDLFLAHSRSKPYLIAPAMNPSMLTHPCTQNSLTILQSWGIEILKTAAGQLACGEVGKGRLLDPKTIFEYVQKHRRDLTPSPQRKKILITSGATIEPIDHVRHISNHSTGQTGAFLAEHLSKEGHDITLLHGICTKLPTTPVQTQAFSSFQDFRKKLLEILEKDSFDSVIHLAAVSDYGVDRLQLGDSFFSSGEFSKIPSSSELRIHLKKNEKLVDLIKTHSKNKNLCLIAFKLTSHSTEPEKKEAVEMLLKRSAANYVVHNDLAQISSSQHPFQIHSSRGCIQSCENTMELAQSLSQVFAKEG